MYFLLDKYKPLNEDKKKLCAVLDSKDFSVDFISWEDLKRIIVMEYARCYKKHLMHKEDYIIWDKFPGVTWRGEFRDGMSLDERIEYIIRDDYHWHISSSSKGESYRLSRAEKDLGIRWLGGKYSVDCIRLRQNYRGIEFNFMDFANSVGLDYQSVKLSGIGFIHSRSVVSMQLTNTGWNTGVDTVIDIDLDVNTLKPVRLIKRQLNKSENHESVVIDERGDILKAVARLKLAGQL